MPPRIRWIHFALPLLASLGLLVAGPASPSGSVYRWVDKDGNVHYSDHGGSAAAQRVKVAEPAPDPGSLADLEIVRDGDASDVYVSNRLGGPLEVDIALTESSNVLAKPSLPLRQLVAANQRVLVSRIAAAGSSVASYSVGMTAMPGDPTAMPDDVVYALPVDEHSGWQLGQGFHGGFSHTDEQNKYAVDIVVPVDTPVLAARDGVVMQVESAFDRNGLDKARYAERANLIRILHDDGTMGVYAHLKENGVYVRVGERVGVGQQIGASGNTGYSSGPHLHFAVQVNRGMRLVSVPFRMLGGARFLPLPGK
jgi:murein DD-endopeptidase MepM/ murein hydrolase activator NlpD